MTVTNRPRRANGAGSVFWVPRLQRWKRAVTLPNGHREIRSFLTEVEAKADLKKALKDLDDGQVAIANARLPTATFLLGWLENEVKATLKPLTHESYSYIVTGRLIPAFGKVPLVKLGPQHLQRLQTDMVAAGLSINTIKSTRTCLGAALSYAADNDLIKPATLLAFRKVKVPRPINVEDEDDEARVFTRDECERFLVAASGDDFEPMFRFMLCTGLRPGEARGVRWQDVDLVGCKLSVRRQSVELKGGRREAGSPKTKKGRRLVPLLAPALAVLTAQQERVKFLKLNPDFNDHDLIFPADDGRPVVSRTVRDHMKHVVEQAGLEHATPHALRHSAATFLLALGIHERVVMNILGHSSTTTTRGYQHVLDEMVQQAGQAYERLLTEMMS